MIAARSPWTRRTAAAAVVLLLWALPFFSLHLTHHAFEGEPDCTVSQIALSSSASCTASQASLALPLPASSDFAPPPAPLLEALAAQPCARAPPGRA